MADRKLMIEVSELLLLESSVPDNEKRKRKMIRERDTVNKDILSKEFPQPKAMC